MENHPLATFEADAADHTRLTLELIDRIRPRRGSEPGSARRSLRAIIEALNQSPERRHAFRMGVITLLGSSRQVSFYSDTGIFPNTGFFTESFRRLAEIVLTDAPNPAVLRDLVSMIFHRADDAAWVREVGLETWHDLLVAMRFEEEPAGPEFLGPLRRTVAQMLEALRVISYRLSSLGLEEEVLRIDSSLEKFESPFLAQNVEMLKWIDAYDRWFADPSREKYDEKQLLVLLAQCEAVVDRVRSRASRSGTSFSLTFLLIRIGQNIDRCRMLTELLGTIQDGVGKPERDPQLLPRAAILATTLIRAECRKNDLGDYLRRMTRLMSLRITENAGRKGGHYITESRREYFELFRAGLGAGFIIAFMAILKILFSMVGFAPVNQILVYGLNYGLGFVIIHMMHYTVATKQPAMTANAIAAAIGEGRGSDRDMESLATIISRTVRSQLAAIAGNVLLVVPTAILIVAAFKACTGLPAFSPEKADHLLHDVHAWKSGSIVFAAFAGVCLFLSGLVAGFFDNYCAYNRIPVRIMHTRWLVSLIGPKRTHRLARYLEKESGALAGNFLFGMMLAGVWGVGFLFGLPLDIRHITFSAAFTAFAVAEQGFHTPPSVWIPAVIGVGLIGAINLGVSFGLALFVALRSRGAVLDWPKLVKALARHFRNNPGEFFLPPKAEPAQHAGR